MSQFIIEAVYFLTALLFIYGLKRMASPVTARSGILIAGIGMVLAVLAAFLNGLVGRAEALDHLNM